MRIARPWFAIALTAIATAIAPIGVVPAAQAAEGEETIRFHGLLDLVLAPSTEAAELNLLNAGGSPFDPYRMRLFVEGKPADKFDVFAQFHLSEATGLVVYGAYATWTPDPDRDLHLEAGKIPWPIGTFGPRTYSDKNPLVGTPLLYQHHTSFPWFSPGQTADELLAGAGLRVGRPIIYDFCWDFGVVAVGSVRPLEFSLGMVNGTPSAPNAGRDDNTDKSILGRVGVTPTASTRFGISGSVGSYMQDSAEPFLPAGTSAERYDQVVLMADAEWAQGRFELRGEGVVNRWESPTLGYLTLRGYYVEGKLAFSSGMFVAARWEELVFDEITGTTGPARPWDDDVRRFEGGVGYRIDRHVTAKAVYQVNWMDPGAAGTTRRSEMLAAQLGLGF
jgi:hypothetical protein